MVTDRGDPFVTRRLLDRLRRNLSVTQKITLSQPCHAPKPTPCRPFVRHRAYATESTAQYIVKMAFTSDRFGYASAVAIGLLALSAILALSVTSLLRRREVDL